MTPALPRLTLVLGGARSGKSRFAEGLIAKAPAPWIYIATAKDLDDEMGLRIAEHGQRRGPAWTTIEVPLDLAGTLRDRGQDGTPMLVDCLTLWLSNVMLGGQSAEREIGELLSSLAAVKGPLIVVSNEVGLGIVPDNWLGRAFRDAQGRLNAQVAELADHVVFIAAGLPLTLKQP